MATATSSSAPDSRATPDLRPLLAAESVAIVGASDRNYYTRSVFENLRAFAFPAERIVLVNPNRPEAFGVPCVPRLERPVDVAVVATPNATVPDVVRELATVGVRVCVVLSDGFAESGPAGAQLQAQVVEAAGPMLLVGPNTMGVIVPRAGLGLWGARLPALRDGPVATVFQSSGLTNLFVQLLAERHVGLRAAISVGNEAGLSFADGLAALVEDRGVSVITTFIESVGNAYALRRALDRADEAGKPVVALRVGRSERGQRNVTSHTGKLATPSAALDALLEQSGVTAVANVDELLETTAMFARSVKAPLRSSGVALVTISGGDATLLADLASRVGLPLVEPRERDELARIVGKPDLLGDPLDAEDLLRSDPEGFFRAVDMLARDDQVGILAARLNLPEPSDPMRASYARVTEIVRARGVLPVFLSRASESLDERWYSMFEELGVPFLREYENALRAIASLVAFDRRRAEPQRPRLIAPRGKARGYRLPGAGGALPYFETARLLRAFGIPLARTEVVATATEAAAAAARLGYPVALKADAPHKSDLGAVHLELADDASVRAAFEGVSSRAPGRPVLVQGMERPVAEAIVGFRRDDLLGPVVAVGIGGAFVEILDDLSLRLPPIRRRDALAMIAKLRGAPLLNGARGRERADVDALADLIVHVGELASEVPRVAELDLNPVIVRRHGEGVVAVDALAVASAAP